jgi:alpha-beta hydrolase superfamily lysophospholipase
MATFLYDGPGQGELTSLQQRVLLMKLEEYHAVITTIIDYLIEKCSDKFDPKRIGLWGQSLGGHLSIRSFEHEQRPMAVVSLSGPPDIKAYPFLPGDAMEEGRDMCGFKTFSETWDYFQKASDAHSVAKFIKVPILMIHGSRDDLMPEEGVRKLAEEIGPKAEFVVYPDGNHGVFNWDLMMTDFASDWLSEKLNIKEVKPTK